MSFQLLVISAKNSDTTYTVSLVCQLYRTSNRCTWYFFSLSLYLPSPFLPLVKERDSHITHCAGYLPVVCKHCDLTVRSVYLHEWRFFYSLPSPFSPLLLLPLFIHLRELICFHLMEPIDLVKMFFVDFDVISNWKCQTRNVLKKTNLSDTQLTRAIVLNTWIAHDRATDALPPNTVFYLLSQRNSKYCVLDCGLHSGAKLNCESQNKASSDLWLPLLLLLNKIIKPLEIESVCIQVVI